MSRAADALIKIYIGAIKVPFSPPPSLSGGRHVGESVTSAIDKYVNLGSATYNMQERYGED